MSKFYHLKGGGLPYVVLIEQDERYIMNERSTERRTLPVPGVKLVTLYFITDYIPKTLTKRRVYFIFSKDSSFEKYGKKRRTMSPHPCNTTLDTVEVNKYSVVGILVPLTPRLLVFLGHRSYCINSMTRFES